MGDSAAQSKDAPSPAYDQQKVQLHYAYQGSLAEQNAFAHSKPANRAHAVSSGPILDAVGQKIATAVKNHNGLELQNALGNLSDADFRTEMTVKQ